MGDGPVQRFGVGARGRTLKIEQRDTPGPSQEPEAAAQDVDTGPAVRKSLWPERWPAIALQECVDKIEAAAPEDRAQVRFDLPCKTCPESAACLNAKRKELGPLLFDREIQTVPRSSESSLFPRTIFEPLLARNQSLVPHWRPPFSLEHEYAVVQAWDLAWSERTGGDWLVCITAQVHKPSGQRTLLDVQRWQRLSFSDQCTLIQDRAKTFMADYVVLESDASQQIWQQHMAATTDVPVVAHRTGGSKQDLQAGVPGLLITFDNRKWTIPYAANSYHHETVEALLNEFEAFGWNDGKLEGVGEHDDLVMGFWHAEWACRLVMGWDYGGDRGRAGVVPGVG